MRDPREQDSLEDFNNLLEYQIVHDSDDQKTEEPTDAGEEDQ